MDNLTKTVLKRVVGKLCEQNEQACSLINKIANNKYETEDQMWDDVRQYMCPGQDNQVCSEKFKNLKQQVLEDDKILQQNS